MITPPIKPAVAKEIQKVEDSIYDVLASSSQRHLNKIIKKKLKPSDALTISATALADCLMTAAHLGDADEMHFKLDHGTVTVKVNQEKK